MNMLIISSLTATMLPVILFTIAYSISARSIPSREKSSPFECGFDPNHNARIPFSMRFFLLAIIFIVFDIEIVLLIPIPILLTSTNLSIITISSLTFLVILILGLIHEWNEGALNWTM